MTRTLGLLDLKLAVDLLDVNESNLLALKFVHYFSIHRFLIFKTTCNVLISPIYNSFCNNHFKLFIFFPGANVTPCASAIRYVC